MNSKTFREYLYEQAFSKDVMISKFTNNSEYKSGVIKDKERETKRRSDETMETPSS